jgi:hypothetical protein
LKVIRDFTRQHIRFPQVIAVFERLIPQPEDVETGLYIV